MTVYTFDRVKDGPNEILYARYINELRAAIEDLSARDLPRYRMISGRRYGTATALGGWRNGTVSLAAGWLFCVPVLIASTCTISGLSIMVTGTTSTDMILGLYDDDGSFGPGTRLRSGSVSPTSTGVKTTTFGTAVVIGYPQWVWVTWSNPDGGGSIEACTAISPFAGMDGSYTESYVLQAGPGVPSPPDPFPSSGYSWIDSNWRYPNITVVIA